MQIRYNMYKTQSWVWGWDENYALMITICHHSASLVMSGQVLLYNPQAIANHFKNTVFYIWKKNTWKVLPVVPGYPEMRHTYDRWRHFNNTMTSWIEVLHFDFYLSHRLVEVCEINRIHHWCSLGIRKSQPECPPFQWKTRLENLNSYGH